MNTSATQTLGTNAKDLRTAAALLGAGALVAFPTETVYGLGADARNAQAVAAIYAAKGRPSFNPLIVHVSDVEQAKRYVQWSDTADGLARAFWPGALTLVLPLKDGHGLSALVTAGLDTLAIRVPSHPTAIALLHAADCPVAAPSANPSGRISPTSAAHVLDGLSGKIAAVLDDGPCTVGLESTIVGLTPVPILLRAGGVSAEDLETALGHSLGHPPGHPLGAPQSANITAPGQLASHYAPAAHVRLNARAARGDEVLLGFGDIAGDLTLSATGDLIEAAAHLFEHLHALDKTGRPIAVAPIPDTGLGLAINDRLTRAAAPR